ncbi:hypothetical protein [Oceanobacillus kimchii]|uniref:Uncharacterized protein n=1 Tax=Oceanobacillus kimchii TaxID=746691 RepID=A0ABQ5TJV5_9BACI|nr:hypothetical protein [Oceanobacillus kimchii]GLO66285.1 hypothetical protein MACH08_20690 [Oceanobacillus kimchii]
MSNLRIIELNMQKLRDQLVTASRFTNDITSDSYRKQLRVEFNILHKLLAESNKLESELTQ